MASRALTARLSNAVTSCPESTSAGQASCWSFHSMSTCSPSVGRSRLAACVTVSLASVLVGNRIGENIDGAGDDGQKVVEVVCDAAGELSDGIHLLRVAQLLLELVALG